MKFCSKIKYFTNQISGKTFSLLVHRGKPAYIVWYLNLLNVHRDFPGSAVVKNLPANTGDMGASPGPGRSHMPRSN